ncbi:MAG: ABC transporter ATP-binding protein [Anaerolineae bacterium]|jgi:ABC-2 type transport system ATP-binding protein|nr:ABC transporter ATP-binding protein [Anaerolineae bacterium]
MEPNDSVVIETHSLSKAYKGVQALKGLSLKVRQHSIFGFLGPNGAGKTTTMKLLLGLVRPTGGAGTIFGYDIERESVAIRSRVGYLAQDPRFFEAMSARETLRFVAGFFYKGPKGAIEERIQETLALVGLEDKADRPVKGFSGGERQRLGIAQAQINYPDLLILDEPAAALDPMGRRDVLEVMERLRKHTTIFYSTHILDDVQRVSDTVAILNHGELVAQAPIEELLAGDDKPVFTLSLRGDASRALARIKALPWVVGVRETAHEGTVTWNISVTDAQAAEVQLLPHVLAGEALAVVEFGRRKLGLEEVFMSIVEGGQDGRQR